MQSLAEMMSAITPTIRHSKNGTSRFFDTTGLTWVHEIESRWRVIRTELDRLTGALDLLPGIEEISPIQSALSSDRRWKVFPLYAYGRRLERNEQRCPESVKLARLIPGIRTAMFSILEPGKEIPEHEGLYCGLLRFHLGLRIPVPETLAGIRVGGTMAHWQEGRSLIFDDTHVHSAWNRGSVDRAILLADFARPLDPPLRAANEQVIHSIAQSELTNEFEDLWAAWEARHGAQFDACLERVDSAQSTT
jgi:aspartyl/asparaginyl beta-hydroxylase (cupin superfamily)